LFYPENRAAGLPDPVQAIVTSTYAKTVSLVPVKQTAECKRENGCDTDRVPNNDLPE